MAWRSKTARPRRSPALRVKPLGWAEPASERWKTLVEFDPASLRAAESEFPAAHAPRVAATAADAAAVTMRVMRLVFTVILPLWSGGRIGRRGGRCAARFVAERVLGRAGVDATVVGRATGGVRGRWGWMASLGRRGSRGLGRGRLGVGAEPGPAARGWRKSLSCGTAVGWRVLGRWSGVVWSLPGSWRDDAGVVPAVSAWVVGCFLEPCVMSVDGARDDIVERAGLLANRVRLAEAEGGGSGSTSAVSEVVAGAVSGLSASDANAVLREAERQMPGWFGGRAVTDSRGRVSVIDAAELRDPSFLAEELSLLAGKLRERERRALGDRLAAAGVSPAGVEGAAEGEGAASVKKALGLGDGRALATDRVLKAFALVVQEYVRSVDDLSWATWRALAPHSNRRKSDELHVLLGRYVDADGRGSIDRVRSGFADSRQLMTSLLSALDQAGGVAFRRVNTLSPFGIESRAESQRGGLESLEAACWKLYKEEASRLDEATVEADARRAIAEYAEGLWRRDEG